MFDILGGDIQFYPGWKVQEKRSIKAPSLKQTTQDSTSTITQQIMDEMHVDPRARNDLKVMTEFIMLNNTMEEEA